MKVVSLLTWQNRLLLYLFSLSTLFFAKNYCTNVCPFIDGLSENELFGNLIIIFILHLFLREVLYRSFGTPPKNRSLPRHAYYLSIASWLLAGCAAFLLHFLKYPHFPVGSHLKLLSSYWLLGGAVLTQLEYILFEQTYKSLPDRQRHDGRNEHISKRIAESFIILTVVPAITVFLVLIRYLKEGAYTTQMIGEIIYVMSLFVAVGALTALYFARMLRKDTDIVLHAIDSVKTGKYDVTIPIKRSDELRRISDAIEEMALQIGTLNREIGDTQSEVVFTMGEIAETRSKETGNHVKRVAYYSELLARQYGLEENEAELLRQASPMHDIGKVGIPDLILNKPGRHSPEESDIMKTHAVLGYEILKHSKRPILKAAAIVAHEHHEKWDGSGYPRGLAGEAIHIYGRITALADVYDALGSDRVYKKAWPDAEIHALIRQERGRHFDPALVDLFFENLDEIQRIRAALKDTF